MAFSVAMGGGEVLVLESVFVINWCFCKHYPNGKWRPHLKRMG